MCVHACTYIRLCAYITALLRIYYMLLRINVKSAFVGQQYQHCNHATRSVQHKNTLHAHTFVRTRERTHLSMRRQFSIRSRRCHTHAALRRVTLLMEAPGPSQTKGLPTAQCGAAPTLSLCHSHCNYTAFFNCSPSLPIAAVLHFHGSASRCLHQAHF